MDGEERPGGRPLLSSAARPVAAWSLASCAIFVAVVGALVARHSRADSLDRAVDQTIRGALSAHSRLLLWTADLVRPVPLAALAAVVIGACLATRRLNGAVLTAISVPAATSLTELVLKPLVGRTQHGALVYPSGHSTGAFVLAAIVITLLLGSPGLVLPLVIRQIISLAALLVASAVAAAVIGLNYHYFSDTLAGAAVGIGVVAGVALILDRASHHRIAAGR